MADRVYLHIGAPKTGTTYLQNVMAANQDAMERQGIRYAAGSFHNDRVWATEVLRGFAFKGRPPQAPKAWDRILRQVRTWDGTAVISHEFFGACTAEQAQRAHHDLAPSEVHLIFTARDYVAQATAVWQERLKYGHAVRLSEFDLDNNTPAWSWQTQDIPAILQRWRNGLPSDRIHVVTVPPPGSAPGLLWDRFASVIGLDSSGVTTQLPAANTSLGLVESELLRRVDLRSSAIMDRPQDRARLLRDLLANKVLSQGSRERLTLPPEQAKPLRARAEAAVEEIRRAGYDVVGSLDDLVPSNDPPSGRTPDDASDAELLEAAVDAIVGLLKEFKQVSGRGTRGGAKRRRGGPQPSRASGARRIVRAARRRLPGRGSR